MICHQLIRSSRDSSLHLFLTKTKARPTATSSPKIANPDITVMKTKSTVWLYVLYTGVTSPPLFVTVNNLWNT